LRTVARTTGTRGKEWSVFGVIYPGMFLRVNKAAALQLPVHSKVATMAIGRVVEVGKKARTGIFKTSHLYMSVVHRTSKKSQSQSDTPADKFNFEGHSKRA